MTLCVYVLTSTILHNWKNRRSFFEFVAINRNQCQNN